MPDPILSVENLTVTFKTRFGRIPVIDDVSFGIAPGEILGIVGESGCGKTMTSLAIMRLMPEQGSVTGGTIRLSGEDLVLASEARMRGIRGSEISMIFQEPMTSLNPVFSVGEQIAEVLCAHQGLSKREAKQQAVRLLEAVKIPLPDRRVNDYPHQFSGGMRQRVMIAIALACKPKVLIADEPTTALDVTVQAHIFELLQELREQTGTSIILITHDIASVAEMAERVMVMYAGRKVEEGPVREVLTNPQHPYTQGLIACVPHLTETISPERHDLLEIPGMVPPMQHFGRNACLFAPRCKFVEEHCRNERPVDGERAHGHLAACWVENLNAERALP
ncbi:MAG TPA: ABC transporter ATP-binding protein [Deltaproteobacteria bacterium]|jgi:peptide/nickel transport system ATP-binding protein/oligopeptide transport system ATP-binding protein|nr:ABC transporter ATP-binding protein [Candidatus Lambdaproteobacteria bacterium]HIL16597.1 ABC transporter ATP-binding protein [Deltaproteobacteria bacterium]